MGLISWLRRKNRNEQDDESRLEPCKSCSSKDRKEDWLCDNCEEDVCEQCSLPFDDKEKDIIICKDCISKKEKDK